MVSKTSLPIQSASLLNPTPYSVDISLAATISLPAGVAVDLKPITLNLFTNTSTPLHPYIQVDLPETHLKGTTAIGIENKTVTIWDTDQFEDFLMDAIKAEEFTMQAEGGTVAYLGILKNKLVLDKKIKLSGASNTLSE
jgi:hypothetical protein